MCIFCVVGRGNITWACKSENSIQVWFFLSINLMRESPQFRGSRFTHLTEVLPKAWEVTAITNFCIGFFCNEMHCGYDP